MVLADVKGMSQILEHRQLMRSEMPWDSETSSWGWQVCKEHREDPSFSGAGLAVGHCREVGYTVVACVWVSQAQRDGSKFRV